MVDYYNNDNESFDYKKDLTYIEQFLSKDETSSIYSSNAVEPSK